MTSDSAYPSLTGSTTVIERMQPAQATKTSRSSRLVAPFHRVAVESLCDKECRLAERLLVPLGRLLFYPTVQVAEKIVRILLSD